MNNIDKLVDLEKKIQYKFQNFGLLEMAMRHSSYANEHHMERLECNERLEFLGDAVLEVVSSEFLYKTFPRLPEGEMTKKRASLVNEPALDLGIVMALVSSFKNRSVDDKTIIFGEVGLAGEVRAVSQPQLRVNEAVKLGFETCILPQVCLKSIRKTDKINIIGVRNVSEAMKLI